MPVDVALRETASYPRPESLEDFSRHIDPAWVEEALAATGVATLRKRRLPMEQVVWLVLGIALFRNQAIEAVVDRLELALPSPKGVVSKSAVPAARERLGEEPMQWLFNRCADEWTVASARRDAWRGLALFGMDGSSLRTHDSDGNRNVFGGWVSGQGDSVTPMVRVCVLLALRSHLMLRASFGPYADSSELLYARDLIGAIPPSSLTILDRLYLSAGLLLQLEAGASDRHWMTVSKSTTKMTVLKTFGAGDSLVEMKVSDEARAKDPTLPKMWTARATQYQRTGFPPRILLSSLRDPQIYPGDEIRQLYHERWEIELAYDELKTELIGDEPTLRSKTPAGVRQEIWGILLGFNLIRLEMQRIADSIKLPPTRISFVAALNLIRSEWDWIAVARSPGAIPKKLEDLAVRIKRFVLPERRSERSFPRKTRDLRRYPRRTTRDRTPK